MGVVNGEVRSLLLPGAGSAEAKLIFNTPPLLGGYQLSQLYGFIAALANLLYKVSESQVEKRVR